MRRALTIALFLSVLVVVPTPPAQFSAAPAQQPVPSRRLTSFFAPYYTTNHGYQAYLGLNNPANLPMVVDPVLYSLDGTAAPLPSVVLAPSESKKIDLREWVAFAGQGFATGSLQISHQGLIAAVLFLEDEAQSLAVNNRLRGRGEFRSSQLEAIWWAPSDHAQITLAISNTTDMSVDASLKATDREGDKLKSLPVPLAPHQTRVFNLRDLVAREDRLLGGISITHDGRPGAIVAQAFVTDRQRGFSLNLPFFDPAKSDDAKLEGTGVLVGTTPGEQAASMRFTGRLLLRNTSQEAITAAPVLQQGSTRIELGIVTLESAASKEVTVSPDPIPDGTVPMGIEIRHSGAPGSLIGVWHSVDDSGSLVVEAPLAAPGPNGRGAGGHPWSLEGGTSAILYIKNTGASESRFIAAIFYPGGDYMLGSHLLKPGETTSFDIRYLRDQQVPDFRGRVLPQNLLGGQVQWFWQQGPAIIGRVNVMSRSKGISHNMSCPMYCACSPRNAYLDLQPSVVDRAVGETATLNAVLAEEMCDGRTLYSAYWGYLDWLSWDPWVADVVTSWGTVACYSPGTTWIDATGEASVQEEQFFECEEGPCERACTEYPIGVFGSSLVRVRPSISGPNTVWFFAGQSPSGYATQITLTSSGGQSTEWAVTAGADKVNLSTTTGSQTTVTSTGTAFSSAVGDIKITATANGQPSAPFAITSRTPYRLAAGTINHQCDSTYGYLDFLNYTIQDQLLTALPTGVPINENWTTAVVNDYNGTNWRRQEPPGSATTAGAQFADQIGGEDLSLPPVPVPVCSGNSTVVQHWGQEWRVGSLTIGVGRRVQTNTLQKYRDHAAHQSIVSPAL